MNKDTILVVGIARNCETGVIKSIYNINNALKKFKTIKYLVIESDSADNTLSSLNTLSKEISGFQYISLGQLKKLYPLRTDRISFCRNKYLSEINNNLLYDDIEYVIVADLDDVNTSLLTESGILSCWEENKWDVCTANQKYAYYDLYALRHQIWQPNDCLLQYDFLKKHGLSKEKALFSAIYSKMLHIKTNSDWIEVDSAFGGLAIYKKNILQDVQYIGLDENGKEICEHVLFHAQLKNKGYRIYINPKLINGSRFKDSLNRFLVIIFVRRIMNNFFIRPLKDLLLYLKSFIKN